MEAEMSSRQLLNRTSRRQMKSYTVIIDLNIEVRVELKPSGVLGGESNLTLHPVETSPTNPYFLKFEF